MAVQIQAVSAPAAVQPGSAPAAKTDPSSQTDSFQSVLQASQNKGARKTDSDKTKKAGGKTSAKDKSQNAAANAGTATQTVTVTAAPANSTAAVVAAAASGTLPGVLTGEDPIPSGTKDLSASNAAESGGKAVPVSALAAQAAGTPAFAGGNGAKAEKLSGTAIPVSAGKNSGSQTAAASDGSAKMTAAGAKSMPAPATDAGRSAVPANGSVQKQAAVPADLKPVPGSANAGDSSPKLSADGTVLSVPSSVAEGKEGTLSSGNSKVEAAASDSSAPGKQAQKAPDLSQTGAAQTADLYSGGNVVIKVSNAGQKPVIPAARQVANAIAAQIPKGRQEFQVNLYPQSLGKVAVKMVAENGILTITLSAANPRTQSLLASNSGEIRSMLQASNGQPVTVNTPQQAGQSAWYAQQQGGGNSAYQQQQQQNQPNGRDQPRFGDLDTGMQTGDFLSIFRKTSMAG